ncbi:polysaccharide biosynthesis C-terminal domain-containing protein [Peribacillus frigoritolerans]|uniref:lipopolysaccharide biosynthesis protein n=1 Tax=Peribacillus frigoritolerans TaxID=450367 RepID=UPI002B24D34E|nr:oligosaccharide flippase family protein [Peribacillus frigoritolerans]MEB2629681.1 polysaccharide biosynthesis C-terminal domain-containing protein [Peribacillus frigoritolerans]
MKIDRKLNSTRNFIFGLINRLVSLLLPFVLRTIMIYTLGVEYLGLSSLFSSILLTLSLAELGFGSAIVYSMYKPIAEDDKAKICALLNLYKKFYRLIGCILLAIGLCITPFLEHLIKGSYPNDTNLYLLYFIYLGNTVISYFLFAYKQSLLIAYQRNDILSNIGTVTNFALYFLQIVILLMFKNYYLYIIILPISTVINNIIISKIVNKKYPGYICSGSVGTEDLKDIKKRVGALVGHRLSGTVVKSADNLVISAWLGLTILAVYNNYFIIITAIIGILSVINTAITPSIGNSIVVEKVEKNYRDFNMVFLLYAWLVGWSTITLIVLLQPFMILWMGRNMLLPFSTVLLFGTYFYILLIRQTVLIYKDAAGMWWSDRYKPYIEAITNLVLNITLVNYIGINGVLISTIVSMVLVAIPWETYALFKNYFNISPIKYYLKFVTYIILTFFAAIITYKICSSISDGNFSYLIVKFLICLVVPNIVFLLAIYRTQEFKGLISMVKSIVMNKHIRKSKYTA